VKIERDVKDFFRDAVFAELRFVGVKMNDTTRTLSGDIVEFVIDDLGYNIDRSSTPRRSRSAARPSS
jgi:uncharacterized lipoprotein